MDKMIGLTGQYHKARKHCSNAQSFGHLIAAETTTKTNGHGMKMAGEKHLIYKEDLLDSVLDHFGCDLAYFGSDLQFCQEAIDMAPAVDAVEVVHGRWEDDGTCSNCKGLNPTYRANKWSAEFPDFPGHFDHLNYCPNCGAKMDGERNA